MKWRFLCGFSAAASLLLAICANAAATTKNIDIVVTHGAGSGTPITTMTIQNGDPSNPIVPGAPGYPYIAGQAFVRSNSDGTAWTGNNCLPDRGDGRQRRRLGCPGDEIATRRE